MQIQEHRQGTSAQEILFGHFNSVIFDVGMNNGDDSAHYLSLGCRVIAVEANPVLVDRAYSRFRREVATGQLTIEACGIYEGIDLVPFWVNDERSVFSSFDYNAAWRGQYRVHPVEVRCVSFDALLEKYGVPLYLKLDIEGQEGHCLRVLKRYRLPEYISVEAETLEHLVLLWELGYRQFKLVDQMRHNSTLPTLTNEKQSLHLTKKLFSYMERFQNRMLPVQFPRGSSGPFGERTRGIWQTFEEVAYAWLHLHFGHTDRGVLNHGSWYDFHAKLNTDHGITAN